MAQLTTAGQKRLLATLAQLTEDFGQDMTLKYAKLVVSSVQPFPPGSHLAATGTNDPNADPFVPNIDWLSEPLLAQIGLPRHSQERKQAAEDLFAAADLLDRPHGWTQFTMHKTVEVMDLSDPDFLSDITSVVPKRRTVYAHCALGAISAAVSTPGRVSDDENRRTSRAAAAVGFTLPAGASVPAWNDWTTRTQAEVVSHLRAIARRLGDD